MSMIKGRPQLHNYSDGDFKKLLKYVKGKHKKTTIIVHKDRLNWSLEESANRVIYIDELKPHISK